MAEKKIAVAQVIPANYFSVRNRRTNERGGAGSKRATIGIGGGSKGASGGGGEPTGPASRMTGGMADGVEGPPQIEAQQAIASQGRMPRFAVGNPNAGVIDLSSILSERPNEAFDSSKPIGGENVPYKATKGIGGFFRRVFGDQANERNLEAQGAQAADWRREDAEVRKMTREDEIEARRDARDEQRFQKRTEVEDRRITEQAERDRIDKANKWVADNEEYEMRAGAAAADRLLKEKALEAEAEDRKKMRNLMEQELEILKGKNQPQTGFEKLDDGILLERATGKPYRFDPGMPGKKPGWFSEGREERRPGLVPINVSTPPPKATGNDVPVDPASGQPLTQQAQQMASAAQSGGLRAPKSFEWPAIGDTAVAPNNVYYQAVKEGGLQSLRPTGAFDVPEDLQKQLDYPATPEAKQKLLKAYYERQLQNSNF